LKLNQTNERSVIILMSTVSSLYCITGGDDASLLFKKFKDPN